MNLILFSPPLRKQKSKYERCFQQQLILPFIFFIQICMNPWLNVLVYYVLAITGFIFRVSVWKPIRCQMGSFTVVMIVENGTTTSIAVSRIKGENEQMIACDNPGCLKECFHMKCEMKNAPRKYFRF